jgi:4-hydroxythreonine-4-phosphate dehydrogenase
MQQAGDDNVKQPYRPTIAITMGDPAGIGAEVIVKALADPEIRALGRFIIYGQDEQLCYEADLAEVPQYWFRRPHEEITKIESGVVVADFDEYAIVGSLVRGPTAEGGHASMRFLDEAIAALRSRCCDALVTGPIHKTSWAMAGIKYPGHTEKLAHAFHVNRYSMTFIADRLRVALASIHEPLFGLRNSFCIGKVFQPIDLLNEALQNWFDIPEPRIAVCGLNPHAGENGRFGDEENRVIEPAIVMAREAGIHAEGPFPADTLFWKAQQTGAYDGIVAMYHDQGLIPIKLTSFYESVNLTLGLPVIRTSVDHGTAFDIVGRSKAHPGSMKAAIRMACDLALRSRDRTLRQRRTQFAHLPETPPSENHS